MALAEDDDLAPLQVHAAARAARADAGLRRAAVLERVVDARGGGWPDARLLARRAKGVQDRGFAPS